MQTCPHIEASKSSKALIDVVPLTAENLNEGIKAVKSGFSYARFVLHPERDFRAAVDPHYFNKIYGGAADAPLDMKYWLAVNRETREVVGTTGLYRNAADKSEASWLGWFSVTPKARNQGIATQLLDFSEAKAREQDSQFLRLYTSDHKGERAAQQL